MWLTPIDKIVDITKRIAENGAVLTDFVGVTIIGQEKKIYNGPILNSREFIAAVKGEIDRRKGQGTDL